MSSDGRGCGPRRQRPAPVAAIAALIVASACGQDGGSAPGTGPVTTGASASAPGPSGHQSESPGASRPGAGLPTLAPDSVLDRTPTRVRIAELRVDLPVVEPPPDPDHFPYCDVAEFLPALSRPGRPGATFLYAHARAGMFLPILRESLDHDGRSMLGMTVEVFTSDDRRFVYEINEIRRHVVSLEFAYRVTAEQLILQTSEGPPETPEKTVVIADPRSEAATSAGEAQPVANPVRCP